MSRRADSGVTYTRDSMDMVITTVAAKVVGAKSKVEGTDNRTEIKLETGAHAEVKGTIPTLPIPKTDSGSSEETRCITT